MYTKNLKRLFDIKNFNKNYVINDARVNKDYDLYLFLQYLNHQSKLVSKPEFSLDDSVKYNMNGKGLPLVITFQGFYDSYLTEYMEEHPNLDMLQNLNDTGLNFAFGSFMKKYTQYNYICLKDNYQSWYAINFDSYINILVKYILDERPSSIYTLGTSAGGFAAILFGHYLNVDKAIAYSPQTLAFHRYMNKYRQSLNSKFELNQIAFTDLGFLQKINNGFNCQVEISVAKHNVDDVGHLNLLNIVEYSEINLNLVDSSKHNVFTTVDKFEEFNRINNFIESK